MGPDPLKGGPAPRSGATRGVGPPTQPTVACDIMRRIMWDYLLDTP